MNYCYYYIQYYAMYTCTYIEIWIWINKRAYTCTRIYCTYIHIYRLFAKPEFQTYIYVNVYHLCMYACMCVCTVAYSTYIYNTYIKSCDCIMIIDLLSVQFVLFQHCFSHTPLMLKVCDRRIMYMCMFVTCVNVYYVIADSNLRI